MKYTNRFNLFLPDREDTYSVNHFNQNSEILDRTIKGLMPDQITLELENGWTNYNENEQITKATKFNGMVFVNGFIKPGATIRNTLIARLPSGWRPAAYTYGMLVKNAPTVRCFVLRLTDSGSIIVDNNYDVVAATNYFINLYFPVIS